MFLISKWYKVSLQDLEVANKALEDEVTKNRARASLHHFLKDAGLKDTYNQASTREKDNYFRHWFANEMSTGNGCKAAKDQRKLVITGETNKEGVWWSRSKLIAEYGEEKALAKIAALDPQPDRYK